jgi:hypothetical protein
MIVAFSAGLAAVLMGVGLALVTIRSALWKVRSADDGFLITWLPVAPAAVWGLTCPGPNFEEPSCTRTSSSCTKALTVCDASGDGDEVTGHVGVEAAAGRRAGSTAPDGPPFVALGDNCVDPA